MAIKFEITGTWDGLREALNESMKAFKETAKAAEAAGMEIDKVFAGIKEAAAGVTASYGQYASDAGKAGRAGVNAANDTTEALDRTDEAVRNMNRDVDTSSELFNRLTKYAAGFFTIQAAKGFARKVFAVRQEIESLQTSFRTLVGDQDKADKLFQSIKEFAVNTPMQLNDLASAAQTMMGFGIPVEQVMDNLKALGDVSMGEAHKFQSLALAFSQVSAAGRLTGQDLLQMINAGFNPLETISEKTGKSIAVLKEEMSKGAISADMIRQAFMDATSEGGKFNGMMEAQSQTLRGAYSNLQGAIDDMLNSIGEKTESVFTTAIDVATFLAKNYETVGKVILGLIGTYGLYKAAVMAVTLAEKGFTVVEGIHYALLVAQEKAQKILNATMLKNPYVAVATALGLVVTALVAFGSKSNDVRQSQEKLNQSFAQTQAELNAEKKNIDELFNRLEKAKKGTTEYKHAKDAILSQYGQYLNGLSAEIQSLNDVKGAYDAITTAAIKAAKARGMERAMDSASEDYAKLFSEGYKALRDQLGKSGKLNEGMISSYMKTVNDQLERTGKVDEYTFNQLVGYATSKGGGFVAGATNTKDSSSDYAYSMVQSAIGKMTVATKNLTVARKMAEEMFGGLEAAVTESPAVATPTNTTTTKGNGKGDKGSKWDADKAKKDRERLLAEWREAIGKQLQDENQEYTDAYINSLDDSTEKILRELTQQEKKQLREVRERRAKLIEDARKLDMELWSKTAEGNDEYNYVKKSEDEYIKMIEAAAPNLMKSLQNRTNQIKELYTEKRNKVINEGLKEQKAALRDFLKDYGSYEQQRLAITQETEAKIAKAKSPYEAASFTMQRDSQLRELEFNATAERMDWGGVFSSLNSHTKAYLEGLRDQLQGILNEGNLPLDQLAVVQEKLREVNTAISKQGGMLSFVSEATREHNRLLQEEKDAQDALNAAKQEETAIFNETEQARQSITDYASGIGADATLPIKDMLGQFEESSDQYKKMSNLIQKVIVGEARLEEARKRTASATAKAKNAEDAAERTGAQKVADVIEGVAEYASKYLSDLPELFDKLGMGDAGDKAKMGLDAINDAAGAASDFASGNYVGAALKAFNALDNIGNIIGVGGLSDPKLEQDIEKLTQSNENLQNAINALSEQMSEASVLDVKEIYEQQKSMLEQTAAQTREMMQRSGAIYDTGFWGTGVGGKHSSNKKIDEAMSASDWAYVSQAAGRTIRKASEFWSLSSKEMYQVMRDANAQWTVVMDKANEGTADAAKFMNEYIELWKKQETLENAYKQRWTSVSFDSVRDSFLSALSDMDKSAYDFSEDFTKYLFNAVMNAQVGDLLNEELKKWYNNFSVYMEEGSGEIPEANMNALKSDWDRIVKEGVSMRDRIASATGYDNYNSIEGSATYNTAKSFTQEQGDILNGRLTAIQMYSAEGNAIDRQIASVLTSMTSAGGSLSSMNDAVSEIRNMMLYTTSYLEDMVRYAKLTYKDFGEKFDAVKYTLDSKL